MVDHEERAAAETARVAKRKEDMAKLRLLLIQVSEIVDPEMADKIDELPGDIRYHPNIRPFLDAIQSGLSGLQVPPEPLPEV